MVVFNYAYLIDAGFKRIESKDTVFFDQYGYNYFIVNKKINEYATLEWDIHTQQLELNVSDKYNYTRKTKIQTIDELKLLMMMCEDILNVKSLKE